MVFSGSEKMRVDVNFMTLENVIKATKEIKLILYLLKQCGVILMIMSIASKHILLCSCQDILVLMLAKDVV